ncbi:hypothetical protein OG21DRAFT_1510836 [Imleria badia]|nr:hypothetical protein OG21DRAFT_1510836 [Imleria badia]
MNIISSNSQYYLISSERTSETPLSRETVGSLSCGKHSPEGSNRSALITSWIQD